MNRRRIRIAFVLVLVASLAVIAHGAVTAERTGDPSDVPEAPPTDNVTVATESARYGTIIDRKSVV
jgi:Flp pilus assembly protein CpaB